MTIQQMNHKKLIEIDFSTKRRQFLKTMFFTGTVLALPFPRVINCEDELQDVLNAYSVDFGMPKAHADPTIFAFILGTTIFSTFVHSLMKDRTINASWDSRKKQTTLEINGALSKRMERMHNLPVPEKRVLSWHSPKRPTVAQLSPNAPVDFFFKTGVFNTPVAFNDSSHGTSRHATNGLLTSSMIYNEYTNGKYLGYPIGERHVEPHRSNRKVINAVQEWKNGWNEARLDMRGSTMRMRSIDEFGDDRT